MLSEFVSVDTMIQILLVALLFQSPRIHDSLPEGIIVLLDVEEYECRNQYQNRKTHHCSSIPLIRIGKVLRHNMNE